MTLDSALLSLIAESRELLQEMESCLLKVDGEKDQNESINAIFRAIHTIKGSSGLFALDDIVGFTHVFESVLDKVRDGEIAINADLVALSLECGDHIGEYIDNLEAGREMSPEMRKLDDKLKLRLSDLLGSKVASAPFQKMALREDAAVIQMENSAARLGNDYWHISLRFGPDVLRNGMDPLSFFRYLGTMGKIISMNTLYNNIPGVDHMDPETCYLGYEISYESNADKATIESVFEFVRDDCKLAILPPNSLASDFVKMIDSLPDDDVKRTGEILVLCGTLTQSELDEVLRLQASGLQTSDGKPAQIGVIAIEQGMVHPAVVEAALEKQSQVREAKAATQQLVRVDAGKLDILVNLVGELVIAASGVNAIALRGGHDDILEVASEMNRLVEEVRDSALNLRMVQIGDTFNRFQRVVRDVSRDIGKDIALEICGGDTELDKMVVEKISDPLTHLVRNAIDHGIEDMSLRVQRGKPAQGLVRLNAFHESGSIVIEVSDDGGGLNRDKILAKAIDKKLVQPGQNLNDQEIFKLIFEPGFSTADVVSNISGRGVGMDVVRRNIEALRGTVEIDSLLGSGTTMRIRLPLTLAIIDGFLIAVGKSSFVIPLDMVVECVDLTEDDRRLLSERSYINLRGEVLPIINLREMFSIEAAATRRQSVVVVQYGAMRAGMVVDSLLGEFQTVIKPLGRIFEGMKGIGGSTILGSGEVALILDVPNLVQQAMAVAQREIEMAI